MYFNNLSDLEFQIDLFQKKNNVLESRFTEFKCIDFYREIFGYNNLQQRGEINNGKYNPIILDYFVDKSLVGYEYPKSGIVFEDMEEYNYFLERDDSFGIITNGCTYVGSSRKEKNSRFMYAMIIDLDYVSTYEKFENLLHQFEYNENVITPTYLVNSGTGFHLYYVFDKPIPLFKKNREWLRLLQNQIQWHVWNDYTSSNANEEDIQKLNITQGYRMVGTNTKLGKEYKARAFKVGDTFSLDSFDGFLEEQKAVNKSLFTSEELKIFNTDHLTLKKAELLYPEWYQERIVEGKSKNKWNVKRDLYDWFLAQIYKNKSIEGARYFRLTTLASFAQKCNISQEEFSKDCFELYLHLNSKDHKTPFTQEDLEDAIEFINVEYAYNISRQRLEEKSRIPMPKNRRNGRTRDQHLKRARMLRDINQSENNTHWTDKAYINNGRKDKCEEVSKLIRENPGVSIRKLSEMSGISRPTIIKWKRFLEK